MTARPRRKWPLIAGGAIVAIVVACIAFSFATVPAIQAACEPGWQPVTAKAAESCRWIVKNGDKPEAIGLVMGGVGLVFALIGSVLVTKRPDNAVPWVFLWLAAYLALQGAAEQYAFFGLVVEPGSVPGALSAAWMAQIGGGPVFFTPLIFFFLLFPTGRLPTKRWRPLSWFAVATVLAIALLDGFSASDLRTAPGYRNPFGLESIEAVRRAVEIPLLFALLFCVAGAALSLVVRFRRSRGDERQQLKWFTSAGALLGSFILFAPFIWSGLVPAPLWVWPLMLSSGLIALPVASAIAILKYRLYDIDVVINRTLVYGALTAVLGAMYVGLVFAFQAALSPITAESDLAIAASTLAIAALFRPVRTRIQHFIDRRFYRRKFDAQSTVEKFAAHLRDEVELNALSDRLVGVVKDTMQPAHISVWFKRAAS